MSADGRVWPADRLRWLAMRHRLAGKTPTTTLGGAAADAVHTSFGGLDEMEHQHIAAFSAFMARIVPDADPQGRVSDLGRDWYRAVMARTAADADAACEPPDADGLAHALWGLQEMSWQLRPALLRIWLEEAEARSAGRPESAAADALRLAALLLNSPLPPSLAALYREFTTA
jgi:hypothetical protein